MSVLFPNCDLADGAAVKLKFPVLKGTTVHSAGRPLSLLRPSALPSLRGRDLTPLKVTFLSPRPQSRTPGRP